jgi:hypothetical protein
MSLLCASPSVAMAGITRRDAVVLFFLLFPPVSRQMGAQKCLRVVCEERGLSGTAARVV